MVLFDQCVLAIPFLKILVTSPTLTKNGQHFGWNVNGLFILFETLFHWKMSSVQPPKWSRPWNDPQNGPRNDPQGIREWWLNMGLWNVFLFFVEILQSSHFFLFLRSFKQKETSCRVTVSFQSHSSRPLTHIVWCNVLNRVVFSSSSVLCFTNCYFGKWW